MMEQDPIYIKIKNKFDPDTGILTVSDFEVVSHAYYIINIRNNFGTLKSIVGLPNEINGTLIFDYDETFTKGIFAESFIGFPRVILDSLYIGCRARSYKGLENTEVLNGNVCLKTTHLMNFNYFPKIGDKARYDLLDSDNIEYILDCLKDNNEEDYKEFLKKFPKTNLKNLELNRFLDFKYRTKNPVEEILHGI